MKKQTKLIRIQTPKTQFREHSTPLYMSSSFCFDDIEMGKELFDNTIEGNIYSRFSNPTVQEFVDKVCMLEDCEEGIATATGMAAVFAGFASVLKSGDHIVSSSALFSSAHHIITQILPSWGINYTYVDLKENAEAWRAAVKSNTKMLYLETPSNPGLELGDMEMLGKLCQEKGLIFMVDNCFATPIVQTPADYGADLIIHSATKFMDGQGRVLGGIIVGKKKYIDLVRIFCRQTGPSMSAFNAWILTKSLETLDLRMERHCKNAHKLAIALEKIEGVKSVIYPFLDSHPQVALAKKQMKTGGALVTIELEGGYERALKFSRLLTIPSLTSNLGDSRTTITHPFTTTLAKLSPDDKYKLGIYEGHMRISVGLEDVEDLIEDFKQAVLGSY